MDCDLDCLQCTAQFQPWIVIFIDICALAGTIKITVDQSNIDDHFKDIGYTTHKGIMISSWILTLGLLGTSICGLIAREHLNKYKKMYDIGNMLFTLGFGGLCAYTFLSTNKNVNEDPNYCFNQAWSINLEQFAKIGEQYLCQFGCQCYIANATYINATANLYYSSSNPNLPIQFQQCPQYNVVQESYSDASSVASALDFSESTYFCSGWCESYEIYLYSNVSRGNPTGNACFTALMKTMRNQGYLQGYIVGIVSICLLIVTVISLIYDKKELEFERQEISMVYMGKYKSQIAITTRNSEDQKNGSQLNTPSINADLEDSKQQNEQE